MKIFRRMRPDMNCRFSWRGNRLISHWRTQCVSYSWSESGFASRSWEGGMHYSCGWNNFYFVSNPIGVKWLGGEPIKPPLAFPAPSGRIEI